MGRFRSISHVLILDEIGKTISGAGMDTKVVNRGVHGEYNPWPNTPKFDRVFHSRSAPQQLRQWSGTGDGGRDRPTGC